MNNTILNSEITNQKNARFKRWAALLLLVALSGTAMAQTLTVTENYNAETVTVGNIPDGYTLMYTLSTDGTDPADPYATVTVSTSEDGDGNPVYNWVLTPASGVTAVTGNVIEISPLTMPDGAILKIRACEAPTGAPTSESSVYAGSLTHTDVVACTVQRYAAPTVTRVNYPFYSIRVSNSVSGVEGGVIRYSYSNTGMPTATNGTDLAVGTGVTLDGDNYIISHDGLHYFRTYSFRSFGAGKFPSVVSSVSTERFNKPSVLNYTPYALQGENNVLSNARGTFVTNSGGAVYVNYNKYNTQNVPSSGLKDPDPYDASTYNRVYAPNAAGTYDTFDLPFEQFKMVAGPVVETPGQSSYENYLFRSNVIAVDSTYNDYGVFCHTDNDGTHHYLALDHEGTPTLVDATEFRFNCLWLRDASNNELYQVVGRQRYYLHREGGVLSVMTGVNNGEKWIREEQSLLCLSNPDLHLAYHAYDDGTLPWIVTSYTQGCDLNLAYDPRRKVMRAGNYREVTGIRLFDISVEENGDAAYQPAWLALDQDASYTLRVRPEVKISTFNLPPHTHFYFTPSGSSSPEDFTFYNNQSYASHREIPNESTDAYVIDESDSRISYTWSFSGEGSGFFGQAAVGGNDATTNGYHRVISRTGQVDRPRVAKVSVTVNFFESGVNNGGADLTGTATSNEVTLFAEQKATAVVPVSNHDNHGGSAFASGRYYLLYNYASPIRSNGTVDSTFLSGSSDYSAHLTHQPEVERVFVVTRNNEGIFQFANPALERNLAWQGDGEYVANRPAVDFNTTSNTDYQQFSLTPYLDATDDANGVSHSEGTYFTIRPLNAAVNLSLLPHAAEMTDGNGLRVATANSSHFQRSADGSAASRRYGESPEDYFRATRWKLVDPRLLPPDIVMDCDGKVTIVDNAGHTRHVLGVLHWQIKRHGETEWGTEQTFTLTSEQNSVVVAGTVDENENPVIPVFAEGDQLRVWKSGGTEGGFSYFAPSEVKEFEAKKAPKPTVTYEDNTVTMTAAATDDNTPVEIYYTVGAAQHPDNISTSTHYTAPFGRYEAAVFHAKSYADNYLRSDESDAVSLIPKLVICPGIVMGTPGNPFIPMMAYVGPVGTEAVWWMDGWQNPSSHVYDRDHYTIRYTLDGSSPDGDSYTTATDNIIREISPDNTTEYAVEYEGYAYIRAKAYPKPEYVGELRASDEFVYLVTAQYYTFLTAPNGTQNPDNTWAEDHDNIMLVGPAEDGSLMVNSTTLDYRDHEDGMQDFYDTYLWVGPVKSFWETAGVTQVMNVKTGRYLTLRVWSNGNRALFAGDKKDGVYENEGEGNWVTTQWNWSYEPSRTNAEWDYTTVPYRLYTTRVTESETTYYYLAFDKQESKWTVLTTGDEGYHNRVDAANDRYQLQVAYRTSLVDYQGGEEFSAKHMSLELEYPANSGKWVDMGDASTQSWTALGQGESVRLRTSMDGLLIHYEPNQDINIHKLEYDRGDPDDPDTYVPWIQWHHYQVEDHFHYTNSFKGVHGYDTDDVYNIVDNLSSFKWKYGGNELATGTDQRLGSFFTYTLTADDLDTEDDESRYLTVSRINSNNDGDWPQSAEDIFSTSIGAEVIHNSPYHNMGVDFDWTKTVHLYAEHTLESPLINTDHRNRFVSKLPDADNLLHYLSIMPGTTVTVDEAHRYLANQPKVETSTEYTQYAMWDIDNVTYDDGEEHYLSTVDKAYTIQSTADATEHLVHLPGNTYALGTTVNNGLYLFNPDSPEMFNYMRDAHNDHPFYATKVNYQRFGLRQYKDGDSTYVVINPYYLADGRNAARYFGLANGEGEHKWVNAYYGDAATAEACQQEFWHTRWNLDHARITPPDVAMDETGVVTLTHRLQTLTPPQGTREGLDATLQNHMRFYYTIGTGAANDPLPKFTTTGVERGKDLPSGVTSIDDITPDANTHVYDPNAKPQLTEGQVLHVVTVLTANLNTDYGLNYSPHVSRVLSFKAEKCPTPIVTTAMEDGKEVITVAFNTDAEGVQADYMITSVDAETPTAESHGFGFSRSTTSPQRYTYASGSTYMFGTFGENKLASDLAYYFEKSDLQLVAEPTVVNADEGKATITLHISTDEGKPALSQYYRLLYTINGNAPSADSDPGHPTEYAPAEGTVVVNPNNLTSLPEGVTASYSINVLDGTAVLELTLPVSAGTAYTFKAQLVKYPANDANPFYDPSAVVSRLVNNGYTGGTLTRVNPDDDTSPYKIESALDLLTVSTKISEYAGGTFKVMNDIDLEGIEVPSIGTDGTPFTGKWNGNYKIISHATHPLFGVCTSAHVYNVVVDNSEIVVTAGNAGAVCATANGDSRFYNCGVRSSEGSTSVTGSGATGGIVGYLAGNSRVINCYNFASVTSTAGNAGGIAGGQENASSRVQSNNNYTNLKGIVFNCMSYGSVSASSGKTSPVLSGDVFTSNDNSNNGINTYLYYCYDKNKHYSVYNCARAAEERYLTRFEFYRGILNSNLKKCGWWTYNSNSNNGNYHSEVTVDGDTIGKWVLDKSIAPYPVVLPKYEWVTENEQPVRRAKVYPSIINPDYENAKTTDEAYKGKKLGELSLTVKSGEKYKNNDVQYEKSWTLNITDMNVDNYDFNYGKVQLPYFQDVFGLGTYIQIVDNVPYIVTGWEITAVTGGTAGTFTTNATGNAVGSDNNYNFADRHCTAKDLYGTSGRVFAQGGFYNVPEGVTSIVITAHWGKAVFLGMVNRDFTFKTDFTKRDPIGLYGQMPQETVNSVKRYYYTLYGGEHVEMQSSMENAVKVLAENKNVYDQAIVLVNNYWFSQDVTRWDSDKKGFTVMSVDEDNDHEPDYCCYTHFKSRNSVSCIRFDNIWMPGTGMAYKVTSPDRKSVSDFNPDFGIIKPYGHFEITETALLHFGQFEYDNNGQNKTKAPLILNGGVFDQFVSTQKNYNANKTEYIQLGGHVWFKKFAPGTHGDGSNLTDHCPITVTGGDYETFYLSGAFVPDAKVLGNDSVHFYANGGRFGLFASGGQERITGNVTIKADHIIADEFYGGGTNPKMWVDPAPALPQIQGNIRVFLNNSKIGVYAGTQYSSMASGMTLTTSADGTVFDTYYGAGYGGSGLNRERTGQSETKYSVIWGSSAGPSGSGVDKSVYQAAQAYGYSTMVDGKGIVVDYEMELIPYSGFPSQTMVARFYRYETSLSKANTNGVTSTLKNCTINNHFYGGGFVGRVSGTATSTLENCTVYGNVYGGGNSSEIPHVDAYELPKDAEGNIIYPSYNKDESVVDLPDRSKSKKTRYYWKYVPSGTGDGQRDYSDGSTQAVTGTTEKDNVIYTSISTADIGQVDATDLTLKGNTKVFGKVVDGKKEYGKVFGGGNEAQVKGTSKVTVTDSTYVESDVFGGGNVAAVDGKTTVVIGTAVADDGDKRAKRPWIKGDVYGGGNEADVKGGTDVTIYEGIMGPVYGGGNEGSILNSSGATTTDGNTHVKLLGGWVGYMPHVLDAKPETTAENYPYVHEIEGVLYDYSTPDSIVHPTGRDRAYYGVFGGGYGLGTVVVGKSEVHVGHHDVAHTGHTDNVSMNNDVHVYGSVYGGGEAGQVGGGYKTLKGLTVGEDIPENTYKFNSETHLPEVASGKVAANEIYYSYVTPSNWDSEVSSVTVASDNKKYIWIAGAAFGGGRGYYVNLVDNEAENFEGTESNSQLPMAGAVYGNSHLTVGTAGQDRKYVRLNTIEYFTTKEQAVEFDLVDPDSLTSGAVYWEENIYVFDLNKQRYVAVTPGEAYNAVLVKTISGGSETMNLSETNIVEGVQYYLETGRVSAAGGGERGPVYGSSAFDGNLLNPSREGRDAHSSMEGGNSKVTLLSGILGDGLNDEVDGCVYGGGLQATVDGTATVEVAATASTTEGDSRKASASLWVRGDVYAGGCMGEVLNYGNADYATTQNLTGGWVRNAHGGSNIVGHGARGNSELVIGTEGGDNDDVVVSESAYGGNGFSPSDGYTHVEVHSGKIGYVYANVDINTAGEKTDRVTVDESGETVVGNETIVLNQQDALAYEGNVYGGGFGPQARVTKTEVSVDGGDIRNGVFGGGELAPVMTPATSGNHYYLYRAVLEDATQVQETIYYTPTSTEPVTKVTVSGGEMGMVCGGGRGYTGFLKVGSNTPGTIMGDTKVTISGGTVRSDRNDHVIYHADLGGGNVYGGGLEGVVTGNTEVEVSGGTVKGRVFGGGRGYREAMMGELAPNTETDNISNRASRDAGAIIGNTTLTVIDGAVEGGVYGGGEGLNYASLLNGVTFNESVATVYGTATVEISGGTLGLGYGHGGDEGRGSYAGGRIAPVCKAATITVKGTANVAAVFGGNDIAGGVNTNPDNNDDLLKTQVTVEGTPRIGHLFGGGNGDYNYYNNYELRYLALGTDGPKQNRTNVTLNLESTTLNTGVDKTTNPYSAGYIGMAFGGGNKAKVTNAHVELIGEGLVDSLFAGGNSITVEQSAEVVCNAPEPDATVKHNVKLLFGGNNKAAMDILPTLTLTKGVFDRVFGGGNAGAMTASVSVTDIDGNEVPRISTYVLVNSSNVTVTNSLFGGCNHAPVSFGTYVDVRKTSTAGIDSLFGGNDISDVVGNSRLDINGGIVNNLFGGGNGYYTYTPAGGRYNASDVVSGDIVALRVTGRPVVNSTLVNIWGGTVNSNIYGGGYAGTCGSTHVVVDDRPRTTSGTSSKGSVEGAKDATTGATITGKIFGAGCGFKTQITSNSTAAHVGNVGTATTDLYHITSLFDAYAYGGGEAGDVENTLITVYPEWDKQLDALYGGCWGSNVTGTATVEMRCDTSQLEPGEYNVTKLYGGNDYSGNVKNSVLNVYNGRYQRVFGGGNGQYFETEGLKTTSYIESHSNDNTFDVFYDNGVKVPNSEHPVVNFYDGRVVDNLYGGGDIGTCKVKITDQTSLDDYAFVQVNVHGGVFSNNIYAGAAGVQHLPMLVYGLKELNMDGGYVSQSVYGGSQSVPDGYKNECAAEETTLRPSSIMNLVGGRVNNNVYGAGYLGLVYGSVYVNVGKRAVETSRVYERTYGSGEHSYNQAPYRPSFVEQGENIGAKLTPADLTLNASIYNGANWGQAGTSYEFKTAGFYGGESRILVDGQDYRTGTDELDLPAMDIYYSLIGAGTSCEGGDKLRDIRVRNYGKWESCNVTKSLWSIQRANHVELENTNLALLGDQDAYGAYPSSRFAMSRCDNIVMKSHNLLRIDQPVVRCKQMRFVDANGADIETPELLQAMADAVGETGCTGTDCERVTPVTTLPYTTLMINNGAYVDVYDPETSIYGDVQGYAYLKAQDNTQAIVTAEYKKLSGENSHAGDGGFFSVCSTENKQDGGRRTGTGEGASVINEYTYGNFIDGNNNPMYRAWKMGNGTRMRQVTLTAHTDTSKLAFNRGFWAEQGITGDAANTGTRMALAKVTLELPPAEPGHYYVIQGGINIDQENGELSLIEGAFLPDATSAAGFNRPSTGTATPITGHWVESDGTAMDSEKRTKAIGDITGDPTHKFGLLITKGANFSDDCYANAVNCNTTAAISGSSWFIGTNGYITNTVEGSSNVRPSIDIYLVYDPGFSTTLLGDVSFKLKEMKYHPGDNEHEASQEEMGDIDVLISLSTILSDFCEQTYELVAMHNEFDKHSYSRKLVLPASMFRRNLYLTSIKWEPAKAEYADKFKLVNAETSHGELNNSQFGLTISPTESLSATLSTTLGWSEIKVQNVDLFVSAGKTGTTGESYSNGTSKDNNQSVEPTNASTKGLNLGVLDGRSSAGVDITLHFNGDENYPNDAVIGNAVLTFDYYDQNDGGDESTTASGTFNVNLNVRTRIKGDTIYIASAQTIERDGIKLYAWKTAPKDCDPYDGHHPGTPNLSTAGHPMDNWNNDLNKGKEPWQYLQTLSDVFSVYDVGDVICVLDTFVVKGNENYTVLGSNYSYIPIVRYSGSHYQFPGDTCAYRGTMFKIREKGKLSFDNVIFDGGMLSKVKTTYAAIPAGQNDGDTALYIKVKRNNVDVYSRKYYGWKNDTLWSNGPIFEIQDGGALTLGNNTIVQNNFNTYAGTGEGKWGGAVYIHRLSEKSDEDATQYTMNDGTAESPVYHSYDPDPQLLLKHTVTIENNLVAATAASSDKDTWAYTTATGAIHIEDGTMRLMGAGKGTQVTITDNKVSPTAFGTNSEFWETYRYTKNEKEYSRYVIKDGAFASNPKANVFLRRTPDKNDEDDVMKDGKSCVITFSNPIASQSRIGVSKEFPGPEVRDTIIIAQEVGGHQQNIQDAYVNGNFVNDQRLAGTTTGTKVFYNASIRPYNLYFHRCASFRKQVEGAGLFATNDELQKSVLQYLANGNAACPDGSDRVVYSVHGGFYPYTYNWTSTDNSNTKPYRTFTTRYSDNQVSTDNTHKMAIASNSDTAYLSNSVNHDGGVYNYSVSATDLAGCTLTKPFQVTVTRTGDATPGVTLPTKGEGLWNDTLYTRTATAARAFKGIHLVAEVIPSDANATVEGLKDGNKVTLTSEGTLFCPGDAIQLEAKPGGTHSFIQWDFDPYDKPTAVYVMPMTNEDESVYAYFGKTGEAKYWKNYINDVLKVGVEYYDEQQDFDGTRPASNPGMVIAYNGDVHIYDKNGLAWLISLCNGLNDQQIHTFFYNTVYIHGNVESDYDMSDYLWTPLGSKQHPFMGKMVVDDGVAIQGIIVNEPNMDHVGFFGYLDSAEVNGLHIGKSVFHGGQVVGGIAAEAKNSKITESSLKDEGTEHKTIVTGYHTTGGIAGYAKNTEISVNTVSVKFMGGAIYGGGAVGSAENVTINNNSITYDPRSTSSIYNAGVVGKISGTSSTEGGSKDVAGSYIANNYVHFDNHSSMLTRAGGLVGIASNTRLENNYVYGNLGNGPFAGSLGTEQGEGLVVSNCYYESGMNNNLFAQGKGDGITRVTSFAGSGNQVRMASVVDGSQNLTLALNRWVRDHGGSGFRTWRSDFVGANHGYPVFGEPDMIPVFDSVEITTCDSFQLSSLNARLTETITEGGTYRYHVVDSADFTDSVITLTLLLHYGTEEEVHDTIHVGDDYSGYGFYLSSAEIALLRQTKQEGGSATVVVSDTLQTVNGCDSVVTLYLTLTDGDTLRIVNAVELKVYPNPTVSKVTVESKEISEVEVFDGVGRRMAHYDVTGDIYEVDLSDYTSGIYCLRVKTSGGTMIKKVVKK